jgi:formate dehydrogenase subunit beta
MLGLLRQRCRQLLQDGTVQVVIGYGQTEPDTPVVPVFITDPNQADQLTWNDACHFNLVTYLNHAAIRALGRAAICVKACDERALVVLEQESQIRREDLYVIGIGCDGVDQPRSEKCRSCEERTPRFADERIGDTAGNHAEAAGRYQPLEAFLEKTPAERMRYWQEEFARCTRCYACRQVCPLCYCSTCIVDKNRPTRIDTSATLKGNFAWHITRAFHLAARCVGCDQCTRVCPAGIDLRLLHLSQARAADRHFAHTAGQSHESVPPVGSYSEKDREEFIK